MSAILKEYDKNKDVLENLDKSLETLINSLLKQKGIKVHQIQTRVKDRDSLEKKILAKQKYKSLDDITDIVGVRIITYFDDEVDQIATLIEEEFVIDQDNSVDKRKIDSDKFGYRSLHYVANLKKDRTNLPEYSSYKEQKFEFQIRTILQHSWAEIEHDLGYKGEFEIPSTAKRTFYRVAALLEQADIEFVKLKSTIADYENSLSQSIKNNPSQIEINKASLTSFMSKNDNVINFENDVFIGEYNLVIEEFNIENYVDNRLINQIKNLGIENVEQLENAYLKNEKATREALKLIFKPEGRSMVRGGSVLVLINYVLSNEKG
ncbi:(p)ppGpp synthetase [Psychrobacter sp. CCUG 69069]|jgi:ppGpp synthetase/RelA/SpoT-type nucleotidyltranferase|uniref:GTP pyrophosphokinase family protein n=1 Tax=Psychrobacter namhaensis TaxID=292734 RepID=A0ABW8L820_9GAMM|nr:MULTISPECIES: (p)ppGpp synthetase [unclassified Psychrobacter]MCD1279903.1 (p)ppGpp synthetase [Psychrobacter sp. CCUG 69069]